MKKIIIISNTAFSIEKFRKHYLSKIKKYFFKVYTPMDNKKKSGNINLQHSKFRSKNIISGIINLRKIIKNENPNIIIVYSSYYILILTLISFFYNFQLISVVAGRGSLFYKKSKFLIFLLRNIFTFILKFSDKIIFINPGDLNFFSRNKSVKKKAYLLPTEGVERIILKNKINKKKKFIFFARLIKEKGIDDYIKVAKIIKTKYPECMFYIAGPKSKSIIGQSKYKMTEIKNIKNKPFVKYLGYIKDYKKIFPKMDCLISPSSLEGAGTSVMEAMQSGLFVIGYKNTGHNYVMSGTGNFICKKNNVNELIKNIENYIKLPKKKLIKINNDSKNKILKNFESNIIAKKFQNILEKNIYSSNQKFNLPIFIYRLFFKSDLKNIGQNNILHLTRVFEKKKFGGIQSVITQISKKSKYNHVVLSSSSKRKRIRKISQNLTSLEFSSTFKIFTDTFSYNLLKYLFLNHNYFKIIHLHEPHPIARIYIFLFSYKKKIIITHHSDLMKYKYAKFIVYLIRYFTKHLINHYHISSRKFLENSEINKFKDKTISQIFSINEFNKKNFNFKVNKNFNKKIFEKYVLFIGRDTYYKGFDLLKKIIKDLPNINFICVTDYKFNYIPKNLKILKHIDETDKIKVIHNARLVISTSTNKAESLGMNLLEAIYLKKPIMGFDLNTGINQLIKNNKNGYIVKKFDVEDYKKKISKIYYDKKKFKKFSNFQTEHYKNLKTGYSKLELEYERLILN